MGARISLHAALNYSSKVERAVVISGSPGLIENEARIMRRNKDDFRASVLVSNGLDCFTESWYAEDLWTSFRSHPNFKQTLEKRVRHKDLNTLGRVLMDMSIGRQLPLWGGLKHCNVPLQLIVGEKDSKFKKIAHAMQKQIIQGNVNGHATNSVKVIEIPSAGHAVHLENPLALIAAIRHFIG